MSLTENIHTSFSYKVATTNDTEDLPKCIFMNLKSLYDNGYLSIKPLEVISRYTDNGKGADIYNIDMTFDLPDEN